ncbi:MAG: hypothetical protein QOD94_3498 [Alphaproteobacteria bacterium]|jgi:hypothetical protein|nr:hypothetical protein [Alphaproteobacteria bacterium]
MRKTLVAAAVATIFSAGAFLASGANAMTLTAPAGMRLATEGVNPAEQVRYVCYRVRSHGGWRRACSWRPNRVVYGGGYPYYGGYYGSPYYYGPTVGIGLGYGGWWGGGYGYGWGGNRTVIVRRGGHQHGGGHGGHHRR